MDKDSATLKIKPHVVRNTDRRMDRNKAKNSLHKTGAGKKWDKDENHGLGLGLAEKLHGLSKNAKRKARKQSMGIAVKSSRG
eukprot:gene14702-4353_t